MPGFPGSSGVKDPPVKQETQVPFLGREDPLEREMPPHSSILAWRIPGTGGAWWVAVYGVIQSRTRLKRLSSSSFLPEGHPWFKW